MRASPVFLMLALLVLSPVAMAANSADTSVVTFYEDPVFKPLNGGDEHPMADLTRLAEGGDVRAQFILGDLYAKGKGGLVKNTAKGKHWFSQSAINGYGASFIRLAALAKTNGNMAEAYSWYDLGAQLAGGKDARYAAKARDKLKLSAADKDKAAELGRDWRKEKARILNDKAAAAKKQPAATPTDTPAGGKGKTPAPATTAAKEKRYND